MSSNYKTFFDNFLVPFYKTLFEFSTTLIINLPNIHLFNLRLFLHFTINTLIKHKKLFILKDKIVKTISTINKFIITINFLKSRDLVNGVLYLGTEILCRSTFHFCLKKLAKGEISTS
jgi:hypothetical protein